MCNSFDFDKLNQKYPYTESVQKRSYVYSYLKDEIEELLCPIISSLKTIKFEDAYVSTKESYFENILSEFYSQKNYEKNLFLTGLTGCGKSTLLNYVFKIFNDNPVIQDHTLIIPFRFDNFDCDGKLSKIKDRVINMLLSAAESVEETCSLDNVENRIDEFINYIKKIHKDSLFFKNKRHYNNTEKLDQLYLEDRWTYAAMLLKFYLSDQKCTINNVVFILDDIESIGYSMQFAPVALMFRLRACMQNVLEEYKDKWNNNFIISCRHFIIRGIKERSESLYLNDGEDNKYSTMESYENFEEKELSGNISIVDIITKRYYRIIKKYDGEEIPEDRKTAFFIVTTIVRIINNASQNFIENLNLCDIRKSFVSLKDLIYNVRWIQHTQKENTPGAFKIKDFKQFYTYFPNIIRALALKEAFIYNGEHSVVPNLLSNTVFEFSNLTILLIIKYFKLRHTHWENSINITELYDYVNYIFKREDINNAFRQSVCNMLINRLLLRGVDADQEDSKDLTMQNVSQVKIMYLPRITEQLWDTCGANSILFQLFVDDIYLPKELINGFSFREDKFFDLYKYEFCCDALSYLIKIEKNFIAIANNRKAITQYINCFSNEPVTKQLFDGLKNSFIEYYKDEKKATYDLSYSTIKSKLQTLKNQVDNLKIQLSV